MTRVMTEAIQALLEKEEDSAVAKHRFLARARSSPDRGTGGAITWTRDEIHERGVR